ncbi:MAG: hypothetical protein PHU09_05830 [Aminobacterium sp.]|nr:hypothetical protein [Aminobacterium sp.]
MLISGYIVLGYLIGKKLASMGYPDATIMLCATLGAAIGLWQGWLNLRQIWQKTKNDKRNKK